MTDFEAFQEATLQDESYMVSMVQSMGLVLEEFYRSLRVVGCSAFTGEGMDEFFEAVHVAVKEYEQEYKPAFEAAIAARREEAASKQSQQLDKFLNDLSLE